MANAMVRHYMNVIAIETVYKRDIVITDEDVVSQRKIL